jgi:hypothetical protein
MISALLSTTRGHAPNGGSVSCKRWLGRELPLAPSQFHRWVQALQFGKKLMKAIELIEDRYLPSPSIHDKEADIISAWFDRTDLSRTNFEVSKPSLKANPPAIGDLYYRRHSPKAQADEYHHHRPNQNKGKAARVSLRSGERYDHDNASDHHEEWNAHGQETRCPGPV